MPDCYVEVLGGIAMSVQAASARPQASPRRPPAKPPPSTQAGRYTGLFDCFSKISKAEGLGALYRGLPANVIGIMPEKTIKLAGNDFFRHYFQASLCPAPCPALVPQRVPRAPSALPAALQRLLATARRGCTRYVALEGRDVSG